MYPPVAFMIWLIRSMRSFMYGPVPPAALFHAPELDTSLSRACCWAAMRCVYVWRMLPRVILVSARLPARSSSIWRMRPSRRNGVVKLVSMICTLSPTSVPSGSYPAWPSAVTSAV